MDDYYVRFSEHTWQIEPPEDSDEPYSFRGRGGLSVDLLSLQRNEPSGGWDWQPVSDYEAVYGLDDLSGGETAWVVVVEYTTGDTFGSHGTWCIAAIKRDRDAAQDAAKRCEGPNDTDVGFRPWDGYFERLESVRVEPMVVA